MNRLSWDKGCPHDVCCSTAKFREAESVRANHLEGTLQVFVQRTAQHAEPNLRGRKTMKKILTTYKFSASVFSGRILLSAAWLTCLAFPCSFLWNYAVAPTCHFESINFGRALAILTLCYIVRLAARGVELKSTTPE